MCRATLANSGSRWSHTELCATFAGRMWRRPVQRISRVTGCLLLLGAWAHAQADSSVRGEGAAAALHWVRLAGAKDCIDGEQLARAVEARLQRAVFSSAEPATLIEGYAERDERGYRAKLRMSASDGRVLGERELSSRAADCRELSETVTVVLAIMIDPEATARGAPPAAPSPTPAPPATPVCPSIAERRQQLVTFARAAVRLLPGIAFGLGAAYEVKLPVWGGLRAEGVGFFERRKELESPFAGTPSSGAYFRLAYGGLAYCPLWVGEHRTHASGCLGAELGTVHSDGFGLRPDRSTWKPWGSASAAARVSIRLVGGLTAQLGASLFVPLARLRYQAATADGPSNLYRVPPFGGTIDVGIGARLGR